MSDFTSSLGLDREEREGREMKRSKEISCVMNSLKEAGLIPDNREKEFYTAIKNGLKAIRSEKYSEKTKSQSRRIHD